MIQNSGLAHLAHHDVHWEYCFDYEVRLNYIVATKSAIEIRERRKWFRLIPSERLSTGLQKALAAIDKANADWVKANADWDKARTAWDKVYADKDKANAGWSLAPADWVKANAAAIDKANADKDKANADWNLALVACNLALVAWDKALNEFKSELGLLHAELFPGCPWNENQHTMFPEKERKRRIYELL